MTTADEDGLLLAGVSLQRRAGRPSREEALAIETLILDGTIQAMRGARYATMSIDALAQDIGVTKQTIYRRFPSKDALIEAAVRHKMDQLYAFARDVADGTIAPIERLRIFVRHMFDMMLDPDSAALAAFVDHAALTDAAFALRRESWYIKLMAPMKSVISAARDQGALDGDADVAGMANMLFDLIHGPALRMRYNSESHDALEGQSKNQAFDTRFDLFLRLYGTDHAVLAGAGAELCCAAK